jgi:phosphatidylglycerol---prolipoprotein diacylglyceryl transferase
VQGNLFELLDSPFPSYMVMLITGFLFATILGAAWAKRIGESPDVVVDLGLSMLIFGILGARLLHVLVDGYFWDYVHLCTDPSQVKWQISRAECESMSDPGALGALLGELPRPLGNWDAAEKVCRPVESDCFAWARFWAGGLTYYGGFLGASIAAWLLLRADRFPFWKAADMAGMVLPIGLTFGRLGCVLGGCCFGRPWSSTLGLVFPPHSPASVAQARDGLLVHAGESSLSVHPTQLYEAWASFALALFLFFWLHGRKRYDGHVFVVFVAAYATLRFIIEFFRADDRGALLLLSTSQWVGLGLVVAAWVLHRRLRQQNSP